MDNTELFVIGAEFPEIKYNGFWDWFIYFVDVQTCIKYQPSYFLVHLVFCFGGLVTLIHALKTGGRLPYLWLGILLHGFVIECLTYSYSEMETFWHGQTPIVLLGRRMPLHIALLYPCFDYQSNVAVAKLRLPVWAEPFAVGLGSTLIDITYDIVSINYLHWTWHDTDPNIYDRTYWVPWSSYYFHTTFAASFSFFFHWSRRRLTNSEGKWLLDKRISRELICTLIPSLMGTIGGIILFIPLHHPLHDLFGVHTQVTYSVLMVFSLILIWSAERQSWNGTLARKLGRRVNWTTWLLLSHLILHYTLFLYIPAFMNSEDEISIGLKEPIGPCNETMPIRTVFGTVLERRQYLCAEDYDEDYYDWSCLPDGKPPSDGSSWYTACGVALKNRAEIITVIGILTILATAVFRNLHFKSYGDGVFKYKEQLIKSKSQ